jgi:hypothetical protein
MHDHISFNLQKTIERIATLDTYFKTRVMENDRFTCLNFPACRKSHLGTFYEGQLHHVGSYYDAYVNNHPFRIIVVGQEYGGEPSLVSLSVRRQMVLNKTGLHKTFTQRNPHMRGTTSALRLLYGLPLSVDHASEFLQSSSEHCHLFDAFALVNYLLCSAVQEGEGRRGKATETMLEACQPHFKKAIEILEPTVMVVQSKGFWIWIKRSFDRVAKLSNELYQAFLGKNQTLVAVFAHPSTPNNIHNWGRSVNTIYLLDTVTPTLNKIREIIFSDTIHS